MYMTPYNIYYYIIMAVSYTHLDVYKRQDCSNSGVYRTFVSSYIFCYIFKGSYDVYASYRSFADNRRSGIG